MDSRKGVGQRMEPWETPAWTRYLCTDFPSSTTQSCLLMTNDEINQIPDLKYEMSWNVSNIYDLSLWKRPACQILSKVLDILNVTARVAPETY